VSVAVLVVVVSVRWLVGWWLDGVYGVVGVGVAGPCSFVLQPS
jgi:hypothetical protein